MNTQKWKKINIDRIRNSFLYAECNQNQNRRAVGEINKLYLKVTEIG